MAIKISVENTKQVVISPNTRISALTVDTAVVLDAAAAAKASELLAKASEQEAKASEQVVVTNAATADIAAKASLVFADNSSDSFYDTQQLAGSLVTQLSWKAGWGSLTYPVPNTDETKADYYISLINGTLTGTQGNLAVKIGNLIMWDIENSKWFVVATLLGI